MRSKFNLNNKSFNSLQRAIIYVLIGIFLLDVMGIIIKSMDNKYSVMQYAVARNFFGLFPLVIYLFFSYEVRTKNNTFNLKTLTENRYINKKIFGILPEFNTEKAFKKT